MILGVVPFALVPVVGLLLVVLMAVRRLRGGRPSSGAHMAQEGADPAISPRTWVALAVQLALLCFLAAWCARGWVFARLRYIVVATAAMVFSSLVVLERDRFFAWLDRGVEEDRLPCRFAAWLQRTLTILLVALLANVALELPWNDTLLRIPLRFAALEFGVVLLVTLALHLLLQRTSIGGALSLLLFAFIGFAEHFVIMFKDASIMPSDLLGLETAWEVAGGYEYVMGNECMLTLGVVSLGLALLSLWRARKLGEERSVLVDVLRNLLCGTVLAACVVAAVAVPSYGEDLGVKRSYWTTHLNFMKQGFIPTFVAMAEDMALKEPEGYSEERARELQAGLVETYQKGRGSDASLAQAQAQFEELQPSVVVVMNETFADLSVLDGLRAGYTGPSFFTTGMDDALVRGTLGVSVLGGGTCNTEFEFLTGTSMAFVGLAKYPFTLYNLSGVESVVRQLEGLGYKSSAIHPANGNNWHRAQAYSQLGFDEFYEFSTFEDAETFHGYISDRSTYEKVLDVLADTSAPQFVFDVTIQNHADYDVKALPEELRTSYVPEGETDQEKLDQLNGYLTCIEASDRDLKWFVGELAQLERPVVLVFFGDHQPSLSTYFSDEFFEGEDEPTHVAHVYQTVYAVWANYDVAGAPGEARVESVGADCLAALALEAVGAPLTDFQMAQLAAHEKIGVVSGVGYEDVAGKRYALDDPDSSVADLYADLGIIDYLAFGSRV